MDLDLETFLTALYVMVDDLYQSQMQPKMPARGGPPSDMSDSEVLCLDLAAQWRSGVPWKTERGLLRYGHKHLRHVFPGFTFTRRRPTRRQVSAKALKALKKELDSWVRRRLRCYLWKQWGRRRYRELRKRGVRQDRAWNTCKSAHGPWRRSRSPALAMALPG